MEMLHAKMPARNPDAFRQLITEIKARDDNVLQAGAVSMIRELGPDVNLSSTLLLEMIDQADPASCNLISAVLLLKIHYRNVTDQCMECFALTTLNVLGNLLNDRALQRILLLEGERILICFSNVSLNTSMLCSRNSLQRNHKLLLQH